LTSGASTKYIVRRSLNRSGNSISVGSNPHDACQVKKKKK